VGGAVEAKASVDHCPFHVLESLLSCFIQGVEVFIPRKVTVTKLAGREKPPKKDWNFLQPTLSQRSVG